MGLLSPRLVPLDGAPNEDALKNKEGGGSLALGGCHLVLRCNNQLIVGSSDRRDERMRSWVRVNGGGVFLILGRQIERRKKLQE